MSVEQALLIAAIGGLAMGIWGQWMASQGDEWKATAWVRKHWQRFTKRIKRRPY